MVAVLAVYAMGGLLLCNIQQRLVKGIVLTAERMGDACGCFEVTLVMYLSTILGYEVVSTGVESVGRTEC